MYPSQQYFEEKFYYYAKLFLCEIIFYLEDFSLEVIKIVYLFRVIGGVE